MKIIRTFNWSRRDFCYDAECEHCGHKELNIGGGYDDSNYYNNVVPNERCKSCGESSLSKESGGPVLKTVPRYDPNITI